MTNNLNDDIDTFGDDGFDEADYDTPSRCEDFPCCGHEAGDCNGQKYGSDEAIKAQALRDLMDPDYDPYYDEDQY